MKPAACALALFGCAPTAQSVMSASIGKLPPARVTTKSELALRCHPPDADVELDGVPQGTCEDFDGEPRALPLGKGARRVQVKKAGYLPWDTVVETDGTRVMVDVTLISTGAGTP